MPSTDRRRAVWSVYLVGAVDCADAALLPGCFRSLETEMSLTPSTLAQLVLAQSLAGALAAPMWGYVVDTACIERRDLLIFGCCWWAAASILSGLALGFWSLLLARTLLGVALPLVSPLSQSIIADLFDEGARGKAFGAAAMWCTIGTALGGIGGTALSNYRVTIPVLVGSIPGWRAAFLIGGAWCGIVAGCVAKFCPPIPRVSDKEAAIAEPRTWWSVGRDVARNRTWQLLTLQSLFGGLPFAAFNFLTLLMQYAGYQDAVAAILLGAHRVGSAAGSLVGGHIGDAVAAAGYNRVRVAQASVAWLLVWLLVLVAALERSIANAVTGDSHTGPVSPLTLSLILFAWGLGGKLYILWWLVAHEIVALTYCVFAGAFCEVGCDLPILAEVASATDGSSSCASMIAYKRSVQGVVNPLGAPIAVSCYQLRFFRSLTPAISSSIGIQSQLYDCACPPHREYWQRTCMDTNQPPRVLRSWIHYTEVPTLLLWAAASVFLHCCVGRFASSATGMLGGITPSTGGNLCMRRSRTLGIRSWWSFARSCARKTRFRQRWCARRKHSVPRKSSYACPSDAHELNTGSNERIMLHLFVSSRESNSGLSNT